MMTHKTDQNDPDSLLDAALKAESDRLNADISAHGTDAFLARLAVIPHQQPQQVRGIETQNPVPRQRGTAHKASWWADLIGALVKKPALMAQATAIMLLSSGYMAGVSASGGQDWLDDLEAVSYVLEDADAISDPALGLDDLGAE